MKKKINGNEKGCRNRHNKIYCCKKTKYFFIKLIFFFNIQKLTNQF